MEFVQFFPIGHLAPRLIGMDPIMWDPFRYKLGGRLLNSAGEEFTARYGVNEEGRYVITEPLTLPLQSVCRSNMSVDGIVSNQSEIFTYRIYNE